MGLVCEDLLFSLSIPLSEAKIHLLSWISFRKLHFWTYVFLVSL